MGSAAPSGAPGEPGCRLSWLDENDPDLDENDPDLGGEDDPGLAVDAGSTAPGYLDGDLEHRSSAWEVEILAQVTAPLPPPAGHRPNRWRRWWPSALLVAVIAAVVATLLIALLDAGGRGGPAAAGHTVTAGLDGRRQASFALVSGATTVRLSSADLGDRLYRVSTPERSAAVPRVAQQGDQFRLHLADAGQRQGQRAGISEVDIELNSAVRWAIELSAGATEQVLDLRAGGLASLRLGGGATVVTLALPRPEGTVAIEMTGGVSRFDVHAPPGVPVRVRVGSGGGQATLDGEVHSGIAPGALFDPAGWDGATDRYEVAATAGFATLSVDRA